MPNTDNTHGTFNKQTQIISQIPDYTSTGTIFADADQAKSHIFTTEALAVFNECCTELQWALVPHAKAPGPSAILKVTFSFGTKGNPDITPANDWAGQFASRQQALIDSDSWFKSGGISSWRATASTDHLY